MTVSQRRGVLIVITLALLVLAVHFGWRTDSNGVQQEDVASNQGKSAEYEGISGEAQAEEKKAIKTPRLASSKASNSTVRKEVIQSKPIAPPVAPHAQDLPPKPSADNPQTNQSPPQEEEMPRPALNDPPPESDESGTNGPPPIPKEIILEAIEAMKPAAQECYDSLLGDFPDASGTVRVKFVFETEGDMSRVQMSEIDEDTTLIDQSLHDCLAEAVSTIELPRPPHDNRMTISYPFKFQSDESP